jgi:hypothetical protein
MDSRRCIAGADPDKDLAGKGSHAERGAQIIDINMGCPVAASATAGVSVCQSTKTRSWSVRGSRGRFIAGHAETPHRLGSLNKNVLRTRRPNRAGIQMLTLHRRTPPTASAATPSTTPSGPRRRQHPGRPMATSPRPVPPVLDYRVQTPS